ncbi:hypothetical protein Hanom_Chr14g01287511 [Helianthus anomalus]
MLPRISREIFSFFRSFSNLLSPSTKRIFNICHRICKTQPRLKNPSTYCISYCSITTLFLQTYCIHIIN